MGLHTLQADMGHLFTSKDEVSLAQSMHKRPITMLRLGMQHVRTLGLLALSYFMFKASPP